MNETEKLQFEIDTLKKREKMYVTGLNLELAQHKVRSTIYYTHHYLRVKLYPLYGVMKGIGRFIADLKFTLSSWSDYGKCSRCFKRVKGVGGAFDYKGHTYHICRDCYNNQK